VVAAEAADASSVVTTDTSSIGTEATTKAVTVVAAAEAADASSTMAPRVAIRARAEEAVFLRNRWESR